MKNKINLQSVAIEKDELKNCLGGGYGQPVMTMVDVTWYPEEGGPGQVTGTITPGSPAGPPTSGTPIPGSLDSGGYY